MCPNRKELLKELFRPGHKKNKREWFLSLDKMKQVADGSELTKMKNLYISDSKKLFFLPNHDDQTPDEKTGFFLLIKRNSEDCNELLNEDVVLYPITSHDVKTYMPELTKEKKERLQQNHKVDFDSIRFKDGKFRKMIEQKKEKGEYFTFHFEGFKRLKFQTTGKVWGRWL